MPLSLPALLVLFPDGHFSGARRWFLPFFGLVIGLTLIGAVRLWGVPIEVLVDVTRLDGLPEYQIMNPAFVLSFTGLLPPAVLSLAYRFWKGDSITRQQVKWLLMAAIVVPTVALGIGQLVPQVSEDLLIGVAACAAPLTLAAAVLRYCLYDIDRIVSRTVTYTVVVGVLGLAAAILAGLVGAQFQEPLVVAATTLAVAAVFNPLQRRVHSFVDRRFNRSRYDAERVMDRFAGALRDRLDPDELVGSWIGVVSSTMHPGSAGVWIKEAG